TINSNRAPSIVAPKRMLQNFCTNPLLFEVTATISTRSPRRDRKERGNPSVALQLNSELLPHTRIRKNLDEIHDVPDLLRGDRTSERRHTGSIDARMNAPEQIDRPSAAAINACRDIKRPYNRAPVVVLVSRLSSVIHMATDAARRARLGEEF